MNLVQPSRRSFLLGAALGAAALGLPRPAGAVPGNQRKLVFVFAPGGWDVTRVFAPEFDNPAVAMEAGSERVTEGGLTWVSSRARPSVDLFLSEHRERTLLVNGMMVRSIAHEICTMIAMTGSSSGTSPDWPAIVADQDRVGYTLPHLVLSGPSFPGDKGVAVARTGVAGQLEALVSGEVEDWSGTPVTLPDRVQEQVIDRFLARRTAAAALDPATRLGGELTAAYRDSTEKLRALKDLRYGMSFQASTLLVDQARVAVDALSKGVSRCVTLSHLGAMGTGWDTHADNDATQSALFEDLFDGLLELQVLLDSTPGTHAPTLAEETLVVVLSEMGRTPNLNATLGKDHWPYTSAMLVGPGITGDRVIGGFDGSFYGTSLDPASGEADPDGEVLSAESLGATLLAYCDVDPGPYVSGVDPITGVLA